MMGHTPSTHDSQNVSTNDQSGSSTDSSGESRFLALSSLGIVVLSVALSSLGYGMLPEQMRIHWTGGMGPYYGPEFAPTVVVLIGFPMLIAGIALGASWLETRLRHTETIMPFQPYYAATVLGILGVLLVSQCALIIANL